MRNVKQLMCQSSNFRWRWWCSCDFPVIRIHSSRDSIRSLSFVFPRFRPVSVWCACSMENPGKGCIILPTNMHGNFPHFTSRWGWSPSCILSFSFSSTISWSGRVVQSRVECKSSKNISVSLCKGCNHTWARPTVTVSINSGIFERVFDGKNAKAWNQMSGRM
jgi:hypothetical protein